MAVSNAWRRRIDQGFQRNLADWPLVRRELAALLPVLSEGEALCLRAVYAGLGPQDLASIPAGQHLEDVRTALLARRELDRQVGEELFFLYVLPARVNNEFPDGSRPWLYEQLRDRVKGLGLAETALEVNYWCYAHATYAPADDRTMGPRGVCSRARGRCGEESTLLTAALRAVGVPARQVYAPRWAHCDDNHAWVEFWDGTGWRYMGACEPEEAPDRGWFTSAASRSMLVRALEPDLENGGCRVVNVTARYARTVRLAVRAERGGLPVPGVSVRFQLVNDSQLWTIFQGETDGAGETSMETGLGCLVVSAWFGGRLTEKLVDLRKERTVTLAWEAGFDPLETEREVLWELTPSAGIVPPPASAPGSAHLERLRQCEAERRACEDTFVKKGPRPLVCAGGNRGEIEKFLALPDYDREDKEALLGSLRDKDFADITCEALEDFLLAALPWKEKYEPRIWRREILSARVENESLLPVRCEIAARLAGEGLRDRADVLRWMDGHLRPAGLPPPRRLPAVGAAAPGGADLPGPGDPGRGDRSRGRPPDPAVEGGTPPVPGAVHPQPLGGTGLPHLGPGRRGRKGRFSAGRSACRQLPPRRHPPSDRRDCLRPSIQLSPGGGADHRSGSDPGLHGGKAAVRRPSLCEGKEPYR